MMSFQEFALWLTPELDRLAGDKGVYIKNLITGETSDVRKDYFSADLPAHGGALYKAHLVKI